MFLGEAIEKARKIWFRGATILPRVSPMPMTFLPQRLNIF